MSLRQPALDQWGAGFEVNRYGYKNGGTATNDSPATIGVTDNWSSPNNILNDVGTSISSITAVSIGTDVPAYLRVSNFGFNVPTGATIEGVEAFILFGSSQTSNPTDEFVQLVVSSTPTLSVDNKGNNTTIPTGSTSSRVYGGPTDLWGETTSVITPALVNSTDFGFVFKTGGPTSSSVTCRVANMSLAVYYTGVDGEVRATQTYAEIIHATELGEIRISQAYADVIYAPLPTVAIPTGRRRVIVPTSY